MTESISDVHEHICTRLAPDGQTSIFLHHSQWPEARIDLRDMPRSTRGSVRKLVGRGSALHHQSPGKDRCSNQVPHRLLLREHTKEMPVSLAPGTIPPTAIPSLMQTDTPHSSEGMPASLERRCYR